jgi:Transglutaminase elicitor
LIDPRCVAPVRRLAMSTGLAAFGLLVTLASVVGVRPAYAENFTLEGGSDKPAFSGYWWPMLVGRGFHLYDESGPFTPLLKYGQATGDMNALAWEKRYKLTTSPNTSWWGHCNGWAASTVLEDEPARGVRAGDVILNTGEIKGLLAACHQGDPVDLFSGRTHWNGGDWTNDLRATVFHKALLYYLRDRKSKLIFNLSTKPEVWNYPCYWFKMQGSSDWRNPNVTQITVTIYCADDNVQPSFIGTNGFSRTYYYWIQGNPQAVNGIQAGDWNNGSEESHPQFVWHPAYQRAHEPGLGEPPTTLDYKWVQRVMQVAASSQ